MLDYMDASRCEHSLISDEVSAAASQWRGEASNALTHVAVSWDDKRGALHTVIGKLGAAMSDAALSYVSTDQAKSDAISESIEST
jgi:uncharacterized protein YukE